ncbi:putative leucine-rich repeat-containing protein DDB_G0290503 [Sipha flava]|uniref:Leucine-rich repeat-containing protein DDB_G0290503 n=1 Tax=Sipha flava TaxID=143950 RepID=A0A8B8GGK2_9HEMI|nr:putative leucine-rich repeat-containing protein DDB_G0290503 [Sipha flava]
MTFNQAINDLQNKLTCEKKKICELETKLVTYDADIEKKNELKVRKGNLQQRAEDLEIKLKKMNEEQLCMVSAQQKKLKSSEEEESCLRSKINKEHESNVCMTKKINRLKESEQRLLTEIENLEKVKNGLEIELCNAEARANELSSMVECLRKKVKSKEEELSCVRSRVCERQAELERLNDAFCRLQKELECNRSKLADAKSRAARAEECLTLEKRKLCNELEAKREALRGVKAELADAKQTAECERVTTARLTVLAAEQRDANERDQRDAAARAQRINKENRDKEESVCRMKHQTTELRRDGERAVAEAEVVRAKVRASECLLNKIKSSEDVQTGRDDCRREQLERDRDTLACDVRQKSKKIANLEQQVCCLRDEVGALQSCKNCSASTASRCVVCAAPSCCPPPATKKCPPVPSTTKKCPPASVSAPAMRLDISTTKCCSSSSLSNICTCSLMQ